MKFKRPSVPEIIIGIPVLLLIIYMIYDMVVYSNELYICQGIKIGFTGLIKAKFYANNFILHSLAICAFIGLICKGYFGWFSVTTFYYFYISNWIYIIMPGEAENNAFYFVILIPLFFIFIANRESFRKRYVSTKTSIITLNGISILFALVLTYIKGYIHLNLQKNIWEIIKLIK